MSTRAPRHNAIISFPFRHADIEKQKKKYYTLRIKVYDIEAAATTRSVLFKEEHSKHEMTVVCKHCFQMYMFYNLKMVW